MASSRRHLIVTTAIIVAIVSLEAIGAYIGITAYENAQYAHISIQGSQHATFVMLYDETFSSPGDLGQSGIVNVPPNTNVTIEAQPLSPFHVTGWHVSGAKEMWIEPNAVVVLTDGADSTITVIANITSSA